MGSNFRTTPSLTGQSKKINHFFLIFQILKLIFSTNNKLESRNIPVSASLNSISSNQSGVSRKLGNCPRLNFNTNDQKKKFSKTANGNVTPLRLVNAKKSNTPQGNLLLNDRLVTPKPIITRSATTKKQ